MEDDSTATAPKTFFVTKTAGLTAVDQLTDYTSNESFVFPNTTGSSGELAFVVSPRFAFFPFMSVPEIEDNAHLQKESKYEDDFLTIFENIIQTKREKPIDVKKLYYEQMEK